MGWLDDLDRANAKWDAREARRIHRQLPTLPTPKIGSSVAILISKRKMAEAGVRDLGYKQIMAGDIGVERYAWESEIRATWGDELRHKLALAAVRSWSADVYGLFDGEELVGVASMSDSAGEPTPEWVSVAYPNMVPLNDKRVVYYMATKRPGYGEETLAGLRMQDDGIWLSSIWEAESFHEAMGGTRVTEGSKRFYWGPEIQEQGPALEPAHGGFATMPDLLWEGGQGSGWFSPPKGTHGIGSQGGPIHAPGQPQFPGWGEPYAARPEFDPEHVSPFEDAVENGDVTWEGEELYGGVTRPLEVEFEDQYNATWKVHHGDDRGYHDAFSERAASNLGEMLSPNSRVVAEAVLSEYEGEYGTFHEWIEGQPGRDADYYDVESVLTGIDAQDRLEVMMALDVVISNGDRHDGNWLAGEDGMIWAIDHGHARWEEQRPGPLMVHMHPAWEGAYYGDGLEIPGVTIRDIQNGYTRQVKTFTFREETLARWSQISFAEFQNAVEEAAEQADKRGLYTRVNTDSAWENWTRLLNDGKVHNANPN